jgi:signal peptidase I
MRCSARLTTTPPTVNSQDIVGGVRSGLGCLSWVGAGIIVVALVLKAVWFDMADVGHNGMAPTLVRGERVLIHKRGAPELGTIAVCLHPDELGWVVGRVAATAGMTINSFGKELRIDGDPVRFKQRGTTSFFNADDGQTSSLAWGVEEAPGGDHLIFIEEGGRHRIRKTEVPEGRLFLLGDFRSHRGQDSRAYGTVDASTCRGTIVFRLTPTDGLESDLAHGYFQPVR